MADINSNPGDADLVDPVVKAVTGEILVAWQDTDDRVAPCGGVGEIKIVDVGPGTEVDVGFNADAGTGVDMGVGLPIAFGTVVDVVVGRGV